MPPKTHSRPLGGSLAAPVAGPSSAALLYPSGAERMEDLPPALQELKVARHSACLAGRDDDDDDEAVEGHGSLGSLCTCTGLRPPPGIEVASKPVKQSGRKKMNGNSNGDEGDEEAEDEDKSQMEEEEEDASIEQGRKWEQCACGHDISEHGRIAEEGDDERTRRVRVAVRLDELLEDKGKLLDFDFEDEDIASLRKQMTLGGPKSSTPLPNGNGNLGKRKSRSPDSISRLSSPDEALASASLSREASFATDSPSIKRRRLLHPGDANGTSRGSTPADADLSGRPMKGEGHGKMPQRSQKGLVGASDMAEKSDSVGVSAAAAGQSVNEPHEQSEAKEPTDPLDGVKEATDDTVNIDLAVQGVSVDGSEKQDGAAKTAAMENAAPRRERPAVTEERAGLIRFRVVKNDNDPENLILLTGLKNIFQRQLPKMPREYITRLVLDRNHHSMAIVKRGLQVVGGITYRPFNHRRFAEIVFCAITSTEQVKGYGSHLMNHLKDHVKASSDIMHFLTYADNYAIGYFKKQGFTKEISLDRSVWVGYIKDYEGGTLMQCSMVPRVKYLEVQDLLSAQKEAVLAKIRKISRSHIVHPGLEIFKPVREGGKREDGNAAKEIKVDASQVPGLKESGWTPEMDELSRRPKRGPHHNVMRHILVELGNHASAWPFVNPVNGDEVPDYYSVIKDPMDLSTMETKLENNQYSIVDDLVKDAQLIFDNCRTYNPASSPYAKCANKLEKFLKEQLPVWKAAAGI